MTRSLLRVFVTLCAALAMLGAAATQVSAQHDTGPHPSHIHAGTCAELDPTPTYPLNDVAPVAPEAPAGSVEVAHTTIDATLDELMASPFAINVHESAENVANYIACGDIAGPVVNGLLLIPMHEQNDSGYSGIAALGVSDTGGTNVSVYLAEGLHGGDVAVGTPAVEPVDVTETEAATETEAEAEAETDEAAAEEVTVNIVDFLFTPQVLEISVGTTVTWTNSDSAQHTATANDGAFDSGTLAQGDSFSFTFTETGTFDYICAIHPNMTGQIVVTG